MSRKGSLGARGRLVWVLEEIGGVFCARPDAELSEGSGWDCDRECIGDSGVNAVYCTELFVEGERLRDAVSSNPRTWRRRQLSHWSSCPFSIFAYPFEHINGFEHELFAAIERTLPGRDQRSQTVGIKRSALTQIL